MMRDTVVKLKQINIDDLPFDEHRNYFFHVRQLSDSCIPIKAYRVFLTQRQGWVVQLKPTRRRSERYNHRLKKGWLAYDEKKGYFDTTRRDALKQLEDYY